MQAPTNSLNPLIKKFNDDYRSLKKANSSSNSEKVNNLAASLLEDLAEINANLDKGNSPEYTKFCTKFPRIVQEIQKIIDSEVSVTEETRSQILNATERLSKKILLKEQFHYSNVKITKHAKADLKYESNFVDWETNIRNKLTLENLPVFSNNATKALFLVAGDEFGENNKQFEGGLPKAAFSYLYAFLKSKKEAFGDEDFKDKYGISDEVYKIIEDATVLNIGGGIGRTKEFIEKKIQNQESVLLEGGWTGEPLGHAIYYEILPEPESNGSLITFRIYNLGGGTEEDIAFKGGKYRAHPYSELKGVPLSNVTDPLFLQASNELRKNLYNNSKGAGNAATNYGPDDVYKGLKQLLNPKGKFVWGGMHTSSEVEQWKTAQFTGTCSWRSLMAFLSTHMTSGDYRRLTYEIKLKAILDSIEEIESGDVYYQYNSILLLNKLTQNKMLDFKKGQFNLIEKSFQKMCRKLVRAKEEGVISELYLKGLQEKIDYIDKWIDSNKTKVTEKALEKSNYDEDLSNQFYFISSNVINNLRTVEALRTCISETSTTHSTYPMESIKLQSFSSVDIFQDMDKIVEISTKSRDNQEYESLHQELITLIKKFPHDADSWSQIIATIPDDEKREETIEKMMEQLGELSEIFFQTCIQIPRPELISLEKEYVFCKLLNCQKQLLKYANCKNNDLKNFFIRIANQKNKNFFAAIKDSVINRELVSIKRELEKGSFEFYTNLTRTSEYMPYIFLDNIGKILPPEIISDAQTITSNIDVAEAFLSDSLPNYYKGIRKSLFYNLIFTSCPMIKPISGDPENGLLSFKISDNENGIYVELTNQGYTENEKLIKEEFEKSLYVDERKGSAYLNRKRNLYREIRNKDIEEFLSIYCGDKFEKSSEYLTDRPENHRLTKIVQEDFSDLNFLKYQHDYGYQSLEPIMSFFIKRPEKLGDSDYQTFCDILLFQNFSSVGPLSNFSNLEKYLEDEKHSFFFLNKFLLPLMESAKSKMDIPAQIYLLQLSRNAKEFAHPNLKNQFPDILSSEIRTDCLKTCINKKEQSIVYAEFLIALSKKETLSSNEIEELLFASAYIRENPVENQWKTPSMDYEISSAFHKHAKSIKEYLLSNDNFDFIEKIFSTLRPNISHEKWEIKWDNEENSFPYFVSGIDHRYYPNESILFSKNVEGKLPNEIINNLDFKKCFPEITHGKTLSVEGNTFEVKRGKITYSIFFYKNLLGDDCISIRQERNGIQYEYISEENIKYGFLHKSFILNKCTTWTPVIENYNLMESILFEDVSTQKFIYEFKKLSKDKSTFSEIDKDLELKVKMSDFTSEPFPEFCSNFDSKFTHEWHKSDGELDRIEIPRFGLTFSQKEGKIYSDQIPGYFLSKDQYHPSLGFYLNMIVLEDDTGHKKVVLPIMKFKESNENSSYKPRFSLASEFKFEDADISDPGKAMKYMIFDEQKKEPPILISRSIENNYYLAYIEALFQNYDSAWNRLQKFGNKPVNYNSEEIEYLKSITTMDRVTGDKHGSAAAIRVYAGYLLTRKMEQNYDNGVLNNLKYNVIEYLLHSKNVGNAQLSEEQEIEILSLLCEFYGTNHPKFQIIVERLNELQESNGRHFDFNILPLYQPTPKKNFTPNELSENLESAFYGHDFSQFKTQNHLFTRFEHTISEQFQDIYFIAISNVESEEKKWLRAAVAFSLHKKNPLIILLNNILSYPQHYPNFDKGTYILNINDNPEYKRSYAKAIFNAYYSSLPLDLPPPPLPPPILESITPLPLPLPIPTEIPNDEIKASLENQSEIPNNEIKASLENQSKIKSFEKKQKSLESEPLSFRQLLKKTQCFDVKKEKPFVAKNKSKPLAWFNNEVENTSNSSIYINECNRLAEDFKIFQDNLINIKCEIADPLKLKTVISLDKEENLKEIESLEKRIIEIANKHPVEDSESIVHSLKLKGKIIQPIGLNEAFVYFAKSDLKAIKEKNSNLSDDEIKELFNLIEKYLVLKTFEQQRNNAEAILKKLSQSQDPIEQKDLTFKLYQTLNVDRCYNIQDHPECLVFEFFAGYLIRKDQVNNMNHFLKENGDFNPILEMIMGSGKSSVLLPLIALLRGDGVALPMVIVPAALYENIALNTNAIFRDAFAMPLIGMQFDRNRDFSVQSLVKIRRNLLEMIEKKQCLILTSKSLQSLQLKYIEKLNTYNGQGDYPEELKILEEILNIIASKGISLIDEADTVLDVLHEVCFSLGKKQGTDSSHVLSTELLYEILYNDPEISEKILFESNPRSSENPKPATKSLYDLEVKELLARKYVQKLKEQKDHPEIAQFIKVLDNSGLERLIDYLCHTKDIKKGKEAQEFYDKQSLNIRNIIALAAQEISEFLPHTLTKICDKDYGIDFESPFHFCIPFLAANTPSRGSQFANQYMTMNYTYQYYAKKGIEKYLVKEMIEKLQREAKKQLRTLPKGKTYKDTAAYEVLSNLLQTSENCELYLGKKLNDKLVTKIAELVNSTSSLRLSFVSNFIIPEIELFEYRLNSNPFNLVEMLYKASGFTGTLWNIGSMHKSLDALSTPGTEAKTINLLWKNFIPPIIIKEGTTSEMLSQLEAKGVSYDLISDGAGNFKDGTNREIAKALHSLTNKPVIFYDQKNQSVFQKGEVELLEKTNIKPEDRITFLDQAHTTGSDVPQKRDAIGIVTIGQGMLLRDLLQNVWRLRELDKAQRVQFVMTEEVELIIREAVSNFYDEIGFEDILKYVILNQIERQTMDNFKGFNQELESIVQLIIIKKLIESDDKSKYAIFNELKDHWIKKSFSPPSESFGRLSFEEDTKTIVSDTQIKYEKLIKELLQKETITQEEASGSLERIRSICDVAVEILPEKMLYSLNVDDSQMTVENEQSKQIEKESEKQVEISLNLQNSKPELKDYYGNELEKYKQIDFYSLNLDEKSTELPYYPLGAFFQIKPELTDCAKAFEGICLTLNVLQVPANIKEIDDIELFGKNCSSFNYLEIKDGDAIIHSPMQLEKKWQENFPEDNKNVYCIPFIQDSDNISDDIRKKIVLVKFLDGNSNYSDKELDILKFWLQENDAKKMKELFTKHIISSWPEKIKNYNLSVLKKLFEEL